MSSDSTPNDSDADSGAGCDVDGGGGLRIVLPRAQTAATESEVPPTPARGECCAGTSPSSADGGTHGSGSPCGPGDGVNTPGTARDAGMPGVTVLHDTPDTRPLVRPCSSRQELPAPPVQSVSWPQLSHTNAQEAEDSDGEHRGLTSAGVGVESSTGHANAMSGCPRVRATAADSCRSPDAESWVIVTHAEASIPNGDATAKGGARDGEAGAGAVSPTGAADSAAGGRSTPSTAHSSQPTRNLKSPNQATPAATRRADSGGTRLQPRDAGSGEAPPADAPNSPADDAGTPRAALRATCVTRKPALDVPTEPPRSASPPANLALASPSPILGSAPPARAEAPAPAPLHLTHSVPPSPAASLAMPFPSPTLGPALSAPAEAPAPAPAPAPVDTAVVAAAPASSVGADPPASSEEPTLTRSQKRRRQRRRMRERRQLEAQAAQQALTAIAAATAGSRSTVSSDAHAADASAGDGATAAHVTQQTQRPSHTTQHHGRGGSAPRQCTNDGASPAHDGNRGAAQRRQRSQDRQRQQHHQHHGSHQSRRGFLPPRGAGAWQRRSRGGAGDKDRSPTYAALMRTQRQIVAQQQQQQQQQQRIVAQQQQQQQQLAAQAMHMQQQLAVQAMHMQQQAMAQYGATVGQYAWTQPVPMAPHPGAYAAWVEPAMPVYAPVATMPPVYSPSGYPTALEQSMQAMPQLSPVAAVYGPDGALYPAATAVPYGAAASYTHAPAVFQPVPQGHLSAAAGRAVQAGGLEDGAAAPATAPLSSSDNGAPADVDAGGVAGSEAEGGEADVAAVASADAADMAADHVADAPEADVDVPPAIAAPATSESGAWWC